MKVLQVVQQGSGGAAIHVRALVEGLTARGVEVEAAIRADSTLMDGTGIAVHRVEMVEPIGAVRTHAAAVAPIRKLLRTNGYDVVHLHGQQAGAIGRVASLWTRPRVVYTPHCFAYGHYARVGGTLGTQLRLNTERVLSPLADAIVCVSETERKEAVRDRVARRSRLHTIHNGVAAAADTAADPELADFRGEGPLVGYLSRLSPEKGVAVLIESLKLLHARSELPRTAIVGNGPSADQVASVVADAGLSDRVLARPFLGDVAPTLAALDAFVLPSLWESFPISILEAMAAGLPVIASDVGGVSEAVAHDQTGLLVPSNDANALADAIAALAGDPERRVAMGAAGRARWAEHFQADAMVDRVLALYESIAR